MAKKSNSVSKSQRIIELRKILLRWGRLNKKQIDQQLSAQLNLDEEVVSRTLYRDLEELVNNHEVRAYYFTRDGQKIEEFDPEVHKNTYCEWGLVGSESLIIGQDILDESGVLLLASDRMFKFIKVESGKTNLDFKILQIFFNIPNHFLCLKVSKEALPFTIVVGRVPAKYASPQEIFDSLEKEYGKRILMLSLPYASVSSFKIKEKQFGHAHFHVGTEILSNSTESIMLTDLKSKNKTFYCKVSQIEADNIRKNGGTAIDKTLTDGWDHIKKSDLNIKKIEVVGKANIQSPILIFFSENVPFLIL